MARTANQSLKVIPEQNLTAAILSRKVSELVSSRGRKGTDAKFILRKLEALPRLAIPFGARFESGRGYRHHKNGGTNRLRPLTFLGCGIGMR